MEELKGNKLFEIKEHWTFELFRDVNVVFQKKVKKDLLKCNIVCLFIVLFTFGVFAWLLLANRKFSIPVLACSQAGVVLFFCVQLRFKKSIETAWQAAPDKDGYDETIEFYEDGFVIKRSDAEVNHLYEKFDSMVESSGYLYLIMSKNLAYMIQKANCSQDLVEFLNQKCNGNK